MKPFNQLKSLTVALGFLGALATTAGCGDDSDSELSGLYGIYELTDWTENELSCDANGSSVLGEKIEKFILVKEGEILFVKFVSAETCESLEACREIAEGNTLNFSAFIFESGSDDDGWIGSSTSASRGGEQTCSGVFNHYEMTSPETNVIEILSKSHDVSDVGMDEDDFCDLDEVSARGPTEPCTTRGFLRASFVEGLPDGDS